MLQKTTTFLFSLATASLDGDVGVVANNTAKADRKKGSVPFIFLVKPIYTLVRQTETLEASGFRAGFFIK